LNEQKIPAPFAPLNKTSCSLSDKDYDLVANYTFEYFSVTWDAENPSPPGFDTVLQSLLLE